MEPSLPGGVPMNRLFILGFLVAFLGQGLWGQESILNSYQRNFMRASLSTKADILRDAATDDRAPEFIGQLYDYALNFALQNADILREDPDLITITVIAARGVSSSAYKTSIDTLWKVFSAFRDSQTRSNALEALAVLGKGNIELVENLNQYLANQNNLYRSGMNLDLVTLSACINALASLGDSSSFPVLFSALAAGYPDNISREISGALERIDGNYAEFLLGVIQKKPPQEKLAALRAGLASRKIGPAERGELAISALETTIGSPTGNSNSGIAIDALKSLAVKTLGDLKLTKASPVLVKYFYQVQEDYQAGLVSKDQLVEAVMCLGAMRTSEAAQALALQLGFYNSQTERTGEYDEELVLALVTALGNTGDKIAFDYLLYVGYLAYPENIQSAAKDSISRLKW
jgi:HEAT repeat protein